MKRPNILWYLATFTTLQQLYVAAYAFQPPTTCKLGIDDSDGSVNKSNSSQSTESYDAEEAQWSATLEKMWCAWRAIAPVSALVLQLNIALMPLIGYIPLRSIVVVASFLSTASVASAMLFVSFKENMKCRSKKERWIKATEDPGEICSIDFWTSLSLPLTFLMWSVLLSLASMISLACIAPDQPSRKSVEVGIASGIITISALLVFMGLYRVVKLVK